MTEKELLKVLDMSEDEQWNFLVAKRVMTRCACTLGSDYQDVRKRYLADLAFRLRDEAIDFVGGVESVHKHLFSSHSQESREENALGWFCCSGSPIHFIIAALIAKDKQDE